MAPEGLDDEVGVWVGISRPQLDAPVVISAGAVRMTEGCSKDTKRDTGQNTEEGEHASRDMHGSVVWGGQIEKKR